MRRALWWLTLAVLATICALIATAPVPPSDEWVPMTVAPAVPYIEGKRDGATTPRKRSTPLRLDSTRTTSPLPTWEAAMSDPAITPVRLCCGQRHQGALCPDGSVMCCLCFNRYPLSAMSETEDGHKTDVCLNCAITEQLQLRNRDLAAQVEQLRAEVRLARQDARHYARRLRDAGIDPEAGLE